MRKLSFLAILNMGLGLGFHCLAAPCSQYPARWKWFLENEGTYNVRQSHAWADPDATTHQIEVHTGFVPLNESERQPFVVYEADLPLGVEIRSRGSRFVVETRESKYLGNEGPFHAHSREGRRASTFYSDQLPLPRNLRRMLNGRMVRRWCGKRLLGAPFRQGRMSVMVWDEADLEAEPFVIKMSTRVGGDHNPLVSVALNDYLEDSFRHRPTSGQYILPERQGLRIRDVTASRWCYGTTYRNMSVSPNESLDRMALVPLSVLIGKPGMISRLAQAAGLSEDLWVQREIIHRLADLFLDSILARGALGQNHVQNLNLGIKADGDPEAFASAEGIVAQDLRDFTVVPTVPLLLGSDENQPRFDPITLPVLHWNNRFDSLNEHELTWTFSNALEYAIQPLYSLAKTPERLDQLLAQFVERTYREFYKMHGDFPSLTPQGTDALLYLPVSEELLQSYQLGPELVAEHQKIYRELWAARDSRELRQRQTGLARDAFARALFEVQVSVWKTAAHLAFEDGKPLLDPEVMQGLLTANLEAGHFFWLREGRAQSSGTGGVIDVMKDHDVLMVQHGTSVHVMRVDNAAATAFAVMFGTVMSEDELKAHAGDAKPSDGTPCYRFLYQLKDGTAPPPPSTAHD